MFVEDRFKSLYLLYDYSPAKHVLHCFRNKVGIFLWSSTSIWYNLPLQCQSNINIYRVDHLTLEGWGWGLFARLYQITHNPP